MVKQGEALAEIRSDLKGTIAEASGVVVAVKLSKKLSAKNYCMCL